MILQPFLMTIKGEYHEIQDCMVNFSTTRIAMKSNVLTRYNFYLAPGGTFDEIQA